MADELAKVLTIPDSVTQKMDDVIEKINEIESASNKMADTVNATWKSLANGEIDNYLKKLQDVANATSSKKISIDTTDITKAASEAERWATAMAEVATQASNYAASKTATFAVQQEWNEALKALKEYEDARLRAEEQGTTVSPKAQASHDAILKRLEELRNAYPDLARIKDATWDATAEKLYIKHLERVEKKNQQIEDKEERQAHSRALRAKQIEAANTRILILAEKLSREEGKSQHYAGLIAELQRLQEEYKKLGNSKEDAERRGQLEKEMEQVRASIQSADGAMRRLSNTTRGLFNYSEQLGRAFSLLFSVSAIKNYLRQIREVTAEFELQRVALGSLLQSQEKANELFGQITNLAVRSPFTIKELNTYTKQLAAYNIQYENLFDTTKMLADVSAGLGVDIGRLILAFGQVKAATVLRGTEVRQFTEAGFGILGELAKYYTELEGKLVSVGDVQDRITKKMVKFADVEEIFKRVTSAGGMFYNMQEKMANTLYGKWSNLTDRIDLMLNEIGQNNMGILNLLVDVSAGLADNWEAVATAISLVAPSFVSFKISSAMAANNLKWFGKEASVASLAVKGLGVALKSLFSPLSLALVGFEAIIKGIQIYNREQEQTSERLSTFNQNISTINNALKKIQEVNKAERNANETDEQFAKRKYDDKKKALQSFRSELQNVGIEIGNMPDIKTLSPEQVDEEIKLLTKRARAYANFNNQLQFAFDAGDNWLKYWSDGFISFDKSAEIVGKSSSKAFSALNYNLEEAKKSLELIKNQIDPTLYKEFSEGLTQRDGEDIDKYLARVYKIVSDVKDAVKGTNFFGDTKEAEAQQKRLIKNLQEYRKSYTRLFYDLWQFKGRTSDILDEMAKEFHTSKEGLKAMAQKDEIAFKLALDKSLAQKSWSEFVKTIVSQTIFAKVGIKWDKDNKDGNTPLEEWQKDIVNMKSIFGYDDDTIRQFTTYEDFLDSIQNKYTDAQKTLDDYNKTTADGVGLVSEWRENSKKQAQEQVAIAEKQAAALGFTLQKTKQENKENKDRDDYLKESVSLIEKMGKEYDDALESMGKTAAKTDISTRYSSLLSNLADKAGMDGTAFVANLSFDTSGIISALQKVAEAAAKAGATEAEQAAREAIAEIQGEDINIEVKANVDNFERDLDNVLGQYQLGKELSKLGLGKELTESLFNFESIDLDTVRSFIEKFKTAHTDSNGEIAEDYKEAYEKALKEVTNLENKELQERLKSYHKYLKQSMSDAVAIKLEEARQLDEINKMEIDAATKAQLREGVKRETSEKYDKAKWKEFQDSDMYIQMFEDLDYMSTATLQRLRNRLIEIRDSLHDLPPESLKEIQAQFDKIDKVITQRNPFKELAKSLKAVDDLRKQGRTREVIEEEIEAYDTKLQQTQQEIQLLEKYIGLQQRGLSLDNLTEAEKAKLVQYQGMQGLELEENLDSLKEYYDILKLISTQAGFELQQWDDLGKDLDGVTKKLGVWGQQWDKVADAAKEALDMMGVDSDSIANTFIDLGTNLKDIGLSALQQAVNFKAMGIAANSALGIIGWIAIALQAVVSLMSALFKMHDKRLENQIGRELELIDELQKKYEKLEEAIDSAYSSSTYDQAQDDAIASLEAQNKALERAQAAERDKKKTDQDRIDEWEQQKLDNLEKIAELEKQAIEAYGGFGSNDNIKSAAEDFVSAWMDAFNETGRGLDGLSDKMDEWLNNAIQRQLLMRLSDQYITPLLDQFDDMFSETSAGGRAMTKEEIEAWKRLYEQNSKEFDEKAKAYMSVLNMKPSGMESDMSGLQKGIEGVTETTAQALEALLNSMRYYVSDSNNLLRQFYMSFISADETMNPMLYELKQHTTLLNAIHSLLNSTTKMTNNNGRALKVLMI